MVGPPAGRPPPVDERTRFMSVLEVARIAVRGGMETSFSEGMKSGAAIIAEAPGCQSVQVMQGVENARDFVLVVGWNCIDDH
jgi:heme-degrading monooxygenase HmoA